MSCTVYGASDDLIEVEGDVREEFYVLGSEEENYLAFSNGFVIKVTYDYRDGVWRIAPIVGSVQVDQAPANDEANYSDRAHIYGTVLWVVHGPHFAKVKR